MSKKEDALLWLCRHLYFKSFVRSFLLFSAAALGFLVSFLAPMVSLYRHRRSTPYSGSHRASNSHWTSTPNIVAYTVHMRTEKAAPEPHHLSVGLFQVLVLPFVKYAARSLSLSRIDTDSRPFVDQLVRQRCIPSLFMPNAHTSSSPTSPNFLPLLRPISIRCTEGHAAQLSALNTF
jgi:hypothetical protein